MCDCRTQQLDKYVILFNKCKPTMRLAQRLTMLSITIIDAGGTSGQANLH